MRSKGDWYGASVFGALSSVIFVLFLIVSTVSKPLTNNIADRRWALLRGANLAQHKEGPREVRQDASNVAGAPSQTGKR
jgi:hypothetical protein